jgi:hypothetical protein
MEGEHLTRPGKSARVTGSFTLEIPANLQTNGNGQTNSMNGWNQVFSIDSSGDANIQKLNCSVNRTANNVITIN